MAKLARVLVVLLLMTAWAHAAAAQRATGMRAGVARSSPADSVATFDGLRPPIPVGVPRAYAPLLSLIVPGSGQAMLGQDRAVGYLAVEALAWWMYAKAANERSSREAEFRDLARRVARSHFSTTLPDGPWSYYEGMRDKIESGVYSRTDTGPIVPETDTNTFNGKAWRDAQATNPTLEAALAQYQQTAVKPEFRWSWTNAQLQWDLFKRTTFLFNDANNAATQALIVLSANHVLSMVDAFTTFRLQARKLPDGRTAVGANVRW